ncbi:MAG: DUF421 domain-containing protein [Oscillospiraceae bacterium]|nr:DUF421 domain-containing protein [Oscillospiraceae bacterium]MBQ8595382.1 DUF421 domain-containing protein [Oscillospiraceae bacterium]
MFVVFFRTLIIYFVIIVCLRVMGKRQLGELQPSEFVIAILISNIATLSIEDTDIPLIGAVVPIITLMSAEVILSFITLKSGKAQVIVTGNPVAIIRNGNIDQKSMRDLRFSIEDLMSQLRINGFFDIREVSWAIVETNGQLTVFPKANFRPLSPDSLFEPKKQNNVPPMVLISDGELCSKILKECNLTEKWLEGVLKKEKLSPKEIFLMTCDPSADYYIVKREKN